MEPITRDEVIRLIREHETEGLRLSAIAGLLTLAIGVVIGVLL